jgi:hypothetical protein
VVDADYVSTPGFSFSFDGTSGEFDLRRRTEEQAGTACLPLSKASRLTLWRCDAAQSVLDSGSKFRGDLYAADIKCSGEKSRSVGGHKAIREFLTEEVEQPR